MNKALFGLLTISAVLSSSVLADGQENMARLIGNYSSPYTYASLGVGNCTNISASANNSGIYGTNSTYADVTGVYEADYKTKYEKTWNYSDITGHIFSEAVITKNASEYADNCLARIVFDSITLNESDTLKTTLTLGF